MRAEHAGHNGTVSYREYADMYYGDFWDYTRAKLGDDRLIMSRPVDAQGPVSRARAAAPLVSRLFREAPAAPGLTSARSHL
jgi:hypothetical protein